MMRHYPTTYKQRAAEVIQSFSASFWLKDALQAAMRRDPVDAAHDAELLAAILKQRAAEVTGVC